MSKTHIANAARVFFPPTKQSISADINEMRRELSAASALLVMENPGDAETLKHIFEADTQLRVMETASEKLANSLTFAKAASQANRHAEKV